MEKKSKAMSLYSSQVRAFPQIMDHLKALAEVRGVEAGARYAEAFLRAPVLLELR